MRNGIYGSAAFDLADIERRARRGWNSGIDEPNGAANQRVDRIGHPEVRPTVAARASDQGFEPARCQRFRGHVIRAGTVKHHHRFQFSAVVIDNRAHAAQIAFALFADVADK